MASYKHTKESLEPIIKNSKTWAEVCSNLNLSPQSGSQAYIKKCAIKFEIRFDHFIGRGKSWNKGKIFDKRPLITYLNNEASISSHSLRNRLITEGIKNAECEICKLSQWQERPIVLELDHINSNHFDNSLENLQILCPNCHSMLTRERRRKRKSSKPKIRDYKKERKGLGRGQPRPNTRKVLRPSKEELENMIREMPMVRIAEKYSVTDNAIRKWCKYLQIDFKKKYKAIVCQEQSNNS